MAILSKGTTFATGDSATSTKLNNLVDNAAFVSGASGTTDDSTLEVNGSGRLQIKDVGVTAAKLASSAVTTAKINDLAVTTGKIDDLGVTAAKIAADAVTTAKILDLNVTTGKINDLAVTTGKINDAAVTAPKLSGAQTGTAPVYGARAYVVFDASRNAAGGSDSANTARYLIKAGNVTSVTKTATGKFTVAFTTALPDGDYAYVGTSQTQGGDGDLLVFRTQSGTKSTTTFQIEVMNRGGTNRDPNDCSLVIFG